MIISIYDHIAIYSNSTLARESESRGSIVLGRVLRGDGHHGLVEMGLKRG